MARSSRPTRLGILGFGTVGAGLYRQVLAESELGLEVAFVHSRGSHRLEGVPERLRLEDPGDRDALARARPDLIVEAAHPDVTRAHGHAVLAVCDYLPLSTTALIDDALRAELEATATRHGTRLLLPHGAMVGGDSLLEWRHQWAEVTVTFRKHPRNIDFTVSGIGPAGIDAATTIHDGSVRSIAARFPRNVNTMVTCALVTVGLDACRGILVADPALDVAVAEIVAVGKDGSRLETRREQPAVGVSGTEMAASLMRSVLVASGRTPPPALV